MYKAKNVDTDKALEYINDSRRYQQQAETLAITSAQKYYEGIRKGLDIAEEIFTSINCESKEGTYLDGVSDVIYELAKELDVKSDELRDELRAGRLSLDEACGKFSDSIRDKGNEDLGQKTKG